MAENWDHKDVWRRRGQDFLIEISRHTVTPITEPAYEGSNRWCVYAYIYPKHPHFGKFDGPSLWQDATQVLHLHGDASLVEYPMYEGKVTCVKVGADYHHLHDDRFTHYATPDDAFEVFGDADELFEQLQSIAKALGDQS